MARTFWRLAAAGIVLSGFAWAQEDEEQGRGVAMISLINGEVSVRRGDSGEWVAAARNAPRSRTTTCLRHREPGAKFNVDYDS